MPDAGKRLALRGVPAAGQFPQTGRKSESCPFATLAMLKLLSSCESKHGSPAAQAGVSTMLDLWQNSLEQHPFIFYMGTDFRRLKLPFVWYDLIHVLECLSQFATARRNPRAREILCLFKDKADDQGRFSLDSVWTA